jgi:hypothetical protein
MTGTPSDPFAGTSDRAASTATRRHPRARRPITRVTLDLGLRHAIRNRLRDALLSRRSRGRVRRCRRPTRRVRSAAAASFGDRGVADGPSALPAQRCRSFRTAASVASTGKCCLGSMGLRPRWEARLERRAVMKSLPFRGRAAARGDDRRTWEANCDRRRRSDEEREEEEVVHAPMGVAPRR